MPLLFGIVNHLIYEKQYPENVGSKFSDGAHYLIKTVFETYRTHSKKKTFHGIRWWRNFAV
jgi:hypothetical protein